MNKYGKKTGKRLDDRGAAIVTVIVVSAFITIIATTLLYIASRNYISKQTDYQNKISFYQAEEVLDKLKAYLADDVNAAFEYAYADTLANCLDHKGTPNVDNYYAKSYTDKLKKIWSERELAAVPADAGTTKLTQAVRNFMYDKLIEEGMTAADAGELVACIKSVERYDVPPAKDKFIIVGVKAAYEPVNGYSTYIYADIGLELPDFYVQNMTEASSSNYAGKVVDITECVKYMNWKRYDD